VVGCGVLVRSEPPVCARGESERARAYEDNRLEEVKRNVGSVDPDDANVNANADRTGEQRVVPVSAVR
jgi:hypothetical protein